MEHEGDGDTNNNSSTRDDPQKLSKWAGRVGDGRRGEDHPDYSIIKIGQNTERSPGVLRRLAVTQDSSVWK